MDRTIKAFIEDREKEDFIGKTNGEVYDDYVRFVESYGLHPIGFRSFCKCFPLVAGLTTKLKYARDGNVRVFTARSKDDYDRGLDEFISERNVEMFDGQITKDIHKAYCDRCTKDGYPVLGLCEFSRRICAYFDLSTKTIRNDGEYTRVFTCD